MPTPAGFVKARWLPLWSALTPTGVVGPGDTLLIPEGEARESDHWEPVERAPKTTPKGDS
jgi:hypothetical protein